MKTFRILGAIFFVFGFFFALLGILSSIIPMIENEHFQLILNSFQETSADPLTNTLNAVVRFCIHSGYFLLFSGISVMVAGGMISSSAGKKQRMEANMPEPYPVAAPDGNASAAPKPAYYPGGIAPPTITLLPDDAPEAKPAPQVISTMPHKKTPPISGGVETAMAAEETDAQKLMRHDEILAAYAPPPARPSSPDYTRYPSNTATAEDAQTTPSAPERKPRIISTMGKRHA